MGNVIEDTLKFYFITDDQVTHLSPLAQVRIAISAGATIVQYRHKTFSLKDYPTADAIGALCRRYRVPLIVNDHVLLAKALNADGVHLGQKDTHPKQARKVLGSAAVIGLSVSNRNELDNSDLTDCDYIGTGPAFATQTKADTQAVRGPQGLARVAAASPLPMVAIGGITAPMVTPCLKAGAAGVAVISYITRADDPVENALAFGKACGCELRKLDATATDI